MKYQRLLEVSLLASLAFTGCSSEPPDGGSFYSSEDLQEQESIAETTPYGAYTELVEYQLAKLTGFNNMPEGDTYEDNAYTRYLRKMLNIQNVNIMEADDSSYQNGIEMFIASSSLPDVFLVSSQEDLSYLVEQDLIADLSEAYENCASDRIKEIYASYGEDFFDPVIFDGKMMAVPETNIGNGPNLIWIRQDWMDSLHLKAPKTLEDVIEIVRTFQEKDPGGNGEGKTLGLMVNADIAGTSGYTVEYSLDTIFAQFQAAPRQWIKENGEVVYGSWSNNAKEALAYINSLYNKGLIDQNFSLRSMNNIHEEIIHGHCGCFFGPWWSANNPLTDCRKENPEAEWSCYLLSDQADGTVTFYAEEPSCQYVCVSKDYAHPEIVFKILSVMFDYIRFSDRDNEEISQYEQMNVDNTARPLVINVDYNEALLNSYHNIQSVLEGQASLDDIPNLDASYARACMNYLNNPETASTEDWAAYKTRIEALELIADAKLQRRSSLYFWQTETMLKDWWKLQKIEENAYLRIIMGEDDISSFDDYAEQWMEAGGKEVIKEVRKELQKQ